MLKILFEFEMPGNWKSRAGDQRAPAHFVKPAVIVDFTAGVWVEPEATDAEASIVFTAEPMVRVVELVINCLIHRAYPVSLSQAPRPRSLETGETPEQRAGWSDRIDPGQSVPSDRNAPATSGRTGQHG